MTIMDKGNEEIELTKKKKKKKKQHLLFYKILSFLLIILTVISGCMVIYNEIFTLYYMIPIIIVGIIVLFIISFILNKEKLRKWIKNIFSILAILIIIFDILMLLYGTQTLKFLSSITDTGYRVDTFGIYVLRDSGYKNINDLDDKKITYLHHTDDTNVKEALAKLKKKISFEDNSNNSIEELLNSLTNSQTDAILMENSYETMLKEEFSDQYEKIKVIETIDIVNIVETLKSDADITKDPFMIYISGIDTSGNIASKARSDVNIILGVNPTTHNILMINTPRDFYVTLHSKQAKDKLTHAGIYGVEESLTTLEDLYEADIDYYARINFTSFVKIVNALGGIKVEVSKKFCEQDSHRSFASNDLICLNKGVQTLNGEQALAYARHRKTIGDRARGENQMRVLEAIINKAVSPKIITKYSSLISALEGRVSTNMTTNEMYKFSKTQISNGTNWNFTSVSANGNDSRNKTYSTGNANVYVMEPDQLSVKKVIKAIDNLFEGKSNILEGTEEFSTTTQGAN